MRGARAARSPPSRLRRVGDGLGGRLERVVARRAELRVGNHPLRHLQLRLLVRKLALTFVALTRLLLELSYSPLQHRHLLLLLLGDGMQLLPVSVQQPHTRVGYKREWEEKNFVCRAHSS